MKPSLIKYVDYIKNVGGNIKTKDFDEDWEPIGPRIRKELLDAEFTSESNGVMILLG